MGICCFFIFGIKTEPSKICFTFTAQYETQWWQTIDGAQAPYAPMVVIIPVLIATNQDTCSNTSGRTAWPLTKSPGVTDVTLSSATTSPSSSLWRWELEMALTFKMFYYIANLLKCSIQNQIIIYH